MKNRVSRTLIAAGIVACIVCGIASSEVTPIENILVVDENGMGIFPGLSTMDPVTVEGIALNSAGELNSSPDNQDFIVYVQDDTAGAMVYSGEWYGGGIPVRGTCTAGMRIRVTSLTGFYKGQTNLNDRHSIANDMIIEELEMVGVPEPGTVSNINEATVFDQTCRIGGEKLQGTLRRIEDCWISDGVWPAASQSAFLTIRDPSGAQMGLRLVGAGDFFENSQPATRFDIVGIFEQEDSDSP